MDVKEIITHVSNLENTMKGWSKFLEGLFGFFAGNPLGNIIAGFKDSNGNETADGYEGLSGFFQGLKNKSN